MTEPIKQEIINNIFENGDKLITGPILQTVLIDMIDDVNVKDQEILSKTGSWDSAVTQIPNLATKAEVTEAKNNLQGNITSLSESIARDLTGYATETWVESQGYLKEHQDISNLATKTELNDTKNNLQGNITSLSESVARDLANVSVPEGVATEAWVQSQDYASKTYVNDAISSSSVDLTGYATETWVQNQGYLTEHQDISNLATKTELTSVSESVKTDITNLSESVANSAVWKKGTGKDSAVLILTGADETDTSTATKLGAVAIGTATTASGYYSHAEGNGTEASGWGSHAEGIATKASGEDSHAEGNQTTASGNFGSHAEGFRAEASGVASHAEGSFTEASGEYSHAEGESTNALGQNSHAEGRSTIASGSWSHAEGVYTVASGDWSHAEGNWTKASGSYSHAEGSHTNTSNDYEHAQGRYNHNSTDQIFSIGTGNSDTDRRNAVSVLEVSNNNSYTSSVFVQNVGGYDGTNPIPGTNDLATVINNLPSGGGSSETLWKKGTGTDSIVSVLTEDREANTPTATTWGAIATGYATTASGNYSHAEGSGTKASGNDSHAEGNGTKALGQASHAEGWYTKAEGFGSHAEGQGTNASGEVSRAEGRSTIASGLASHAEGQNTRASGNASHAEGFWTSASNDYEHAQGRYNHSSTNQIFSVGAGERIGSNNATRRNAISVLAVPNSETQVVTSSFFVQNIGGYDGTNPTPGTNDLATVINGMSTGGSSETLWKKGTGKDSAVLILTGDDEANTPTATGTGSIATGYATNASGDYSHAEGRNTKASGFNGHAEGFWTEAPGYDSHAEGGNTVASGQYSHAEGWYASATNDYEHAQGQYNHNSTNQIFSVGAGENVSGTVTKRNAVSILVVPNAETQINTASFFVQNIGGYDGTNPTPGTNDLATVLNNTETWTFTLEDGSTVTKTIVMR